MVSNNGGEHIPLSSLQSRVHTLDANQEIAIICRSGARSANACAFLQHEGFENVYNVKGGMKTWAKIGNAPSYVSSSTTEPLTISAN